MKIIEVEPIEVDIEYKKINIEDFTENGFNAAKFNLSIGQNGYINEHFDEIIIPREQIDETIVLNSGVGHGKSTSIVQSAIRYYQQGYVLIFAVPFKSLISQYRDLLISQGMQSDDITDYREIGEIYKTTNDIIYASNKNIHLLTINCLLGNQGEQFTIQSKHKTKYLNKIIQRCEEQHQKVIIFFDEIHEGLKNFKGRYLYNLRKWNGLIHKNFVVTATFNEASKVIIKYLAELTQDNILILESDRIRRSDNINELTLITLKNSRYDVDSIEFKETFQHILEEIGDKRLNVLSYSKYYSEKMEKGSTGEMLRARNYTVNLCTADTRTTYSDQLCNIGTNFSTGININGNNSALVILLPTQNANNNQLKGIFSGGCTSLVQSIARLRGNSYVYIIMPEPQFFIDSQYESNYTYQPWKQHFNNTPVSNRFKYISDQKQLINIIYRYLYNDIEEVINEVESIRPQRNYRNLPALDFPSLDDFILSDGEKYLTSKYEIFGKDLSIYSFWAAFHNQFLNCKLKRLIIQDVIHFKDGSICQELLNLIQTKYHNAFNQALIYHPLFNGYESLELNLLSDKKCYEVIQSEIFNSKVLIDGNEIQKFSMPSFEKKLIAVILLLRKKNTTYITKFYKETYDGEGINEVEYSKKDYLLSCFASSMNVNEELFNEMADNVKQLVSAYNFLGNFFEHVYKPRFIFTDQNGKNYFETNILDANILSEDEINELKEHIEIIRSRDKLINIKVYSFFRYEQTNTNLEFINQINNMFKKNLFDDCYKDLTVRIGGVSVRKPVLIANVDIPNIENISNLLFSVN